MKNTFEIQNLKINTFGDNAQTILDIPYFSMDAGNELLITGAKGAGKTTLLYALAGLFLRLDGKVKWNSRDIYNMSPRKRDDWHGNHVGFIYQNYQLNDELSVLDNILLPTGFDTVICPEQLIRKAEKLADDFEISVFKPVNAMSLAEKQQIALARALIADADIIMADELTAGLDNKTALTLLKHLRHANAMGEKMFIFTSRDAFMRGQISQQLALENGQVKPAKITAIKTA